MCSTRGTPAWDAGKWVIYPYETLTISGWQVGPERARRFYFTNEHDAYSTRIGRPGDFGVISAVFYRERLPISQIIAGHTHVALARAGWRRRSGWPSRRVIGSPVRSSWRRGLGRPLEAVLAL
jgi:hypothetical protein